eukprot:2428262-Rhodomonas_salina.1
MGTPTDLGELVGWDPTPRVRHLHQHFLPDVLGRDPDRPLRRELHRVPQQVPQNLEWRRGVSARARPLAPTARPLSPTARPRSPTARPRSPTARLASANALSSLSSLSSAPSLLPSCSLSLSLSLSLSPFLALPSLLPPPRAPLTCSTRFPSHGALNPEPTSLWIATPFGTLLWNACAATRGSVRPQPRRNQRQTAALPVLRVPKTQLISHLAGGLCHVKECDVFVVEV